MANFVNPPGRSLQRGHLLLTLVPAVWVLPGIADLLHESDQAALVGGAFQLATGAASISTPDFYNYDKLFLSYWLLAAVLRVVHSVIASLGPVLISNVLSSLTLALAAGWAIYRTPHRPARPARILTLLLAPAFLLHGPFFAAASLSAAALLAAFTLLTRRRTWPKNVAVLIAIFVAVGTRADAVLALPFLVWLTLWPQARPLTLLRRPFFYAMIAAAATALIIGRLVAGVTSTTVFAPVFAAKIVVAYAVFGLGGGMLLIAGIVALLGSRVLRVRQGWRRLSALAGLITFLLPFAFYLPQLFSTRYWFLGLSSALLFVLSRRGAALTQLAPTPATRAVTLAGLALAILPLGIGVRLPMPTRPHLTLGMPTRFPSADGLMPMGNYLGVLLRCGPDGERLIADHNQAIWLASASAVFQPDETSRVPLLTTPMYEILHLRATVRGQPVRQVRETDPSQRAYTDLRSLVKFSGGLDAGGRLGDNTGRLLAGITTASVSKPIDGLTIMELQPTTEPIASSTEPWRIFRGVYAGNDFRIHAAADLTGADGHLQLPVGEGRTLAFAASAPFSVQLEDSAGRVTALSSSPASFDPQVQLLVLDGRQSAVAALRFSSTPPPDAMCAAAVLPDYMSVRSFQP